MNFKQTTKQKFCIIIVFIPLVRWAESFPLAGSPYTGDTEKVEAEEGSNITLLCFLSRGHSSVEWTRGDPKAHIHVVQDGYVESEGQDQNYKNRTHVHLKKLETGDFSLLLRGVKESDEGKYRCFIPGTEEERVVIVVIKPTKPLKGAGLIISGNSLIFSSPLFLAVLCYVVHLMVMMM